MKIYIAGSITHDPDYKQKFKDAEELIKKAGHIPMNPANNVASNYKRYIDKGLAQLKRCDAILLLRNWRRSKGARLEKRYAKTVGMPILKECDL